MRTPKPLKVNKEIEKMLYRAWVNGQYFLWQTISEKYPDEEWVPSRRSYKQWLRQTELHKEIVLTK